MFRLAGEAKACLRIDVMLLNVSVFIVRLPFFRATKNRPQAV
jgi:hypothetical protein